MGYRTNARSKYSVDQHRTVKSIKKEQKELDYKLIKDDKNNLLLFYNKTDAPHFDLYIINLQEKVNNWCSNFDTKKKPRFLKINGFTFENRRSSKFVDKFICVKRFNRAINIKKQNIQYFKKNLFKKYNSCVNTTFRGESSRDWFKANYPRLNRFYKCLRYKDTNYCKHKLKKVRKHKVKNFLEDIQDYLDTHFVPIEILEKEEYLGNKYLPYWRSDFSTKRNFFAGSVKAVKVEFFFNENKAKLDPAILDYGFEGDRSDAFKEDGIIKYNLDNAVLTHSNIKKDRRVSLSDGYIKNCDINKLAETIIYNINWLDNSCPSRFDINSLEESLEKLSLIKSSK